MKIRKLLRILHRDFGYFIVGMTIVYALSGIFLNHRHDLNPDYNVYEKNFKTDVGLSPTINEMLIKTILKEIDPDIIYKKYYTSNNGSIKVFIENGQVSIDPKTGEGTITYLQKRPLIFEMNRLHKSSIGTLWKWANDVMAVILLFVAVSGLFLLKGKRSFTRWGWCFTVAGIIIPIIFVIVYI